MRIEWTQALSTNVPAIDDQHQELLKRINVLLDACKGNRPRQELGAVIDFLEEYVAIHFGSEERLMSASDYPEMRQHKEEHAVFVGRVADLKNKFRNEGAGPEMLHLATRTLIEWLDVHIRRTDRKLGEHLKNK